MIISQRFESSYTESLKVHIDESSSVQIEVTFSTLAEDVCARLNEKYKSPGGDPTLKRILCVALNDSKKTPLNKKILRQLRPDEHILEVHVSLSQKRLQHEFYALLPFPLEQPENVSNKPKALSGRMFKEGKWDRVGELFKSVEDGKESESGRKSLAYNRRTFYLGKDILYYISKEPMQKVNVIPLQYAKVTAGKDLKDSKPIIKISLPSTPALLLKASSQADFVMWYNNIQLSTINAHTKKKLEDFEKALVRLEQEVARTDKKEVASFFTGIDAVLKSEESRSAVFENLQNYKPEYLYLGELYDILQTFDTMCKLGKYNDALSCGKRVYKMLTNFNLKEMSEEDKDFLNEQILEDEVRHMMKSLVSEEIVGKIAKTLEEIEKEGPEKIKEVENVLFSDVTSNLLEKVKAARSEIRAFSRNKITIQDLKLMTIPVSRQKKSLQWTKPKLLREFGVREENFLRFKPASVRLPGYSRNGGMLLAKGASSVITFRRHDISDLETTGAFIDTREDTGMLDM